MGVPVVATSEAVAFCPELATVDNLNPINIAESILGVLASGGSSKSCNLKKWIDVATDFESAYYSLIQS